MATPQARAAAAAQAVLSRRSNEQIPLSLGKASLRIRLEAYYSLISPDTLSNRTVWLKKYDQIYEKYGGTYQGERKLASKLAKKYGTTVRLLVVTEATRKTTDLVCRTPKIDADEGKQDETRFQERREETESGVVDFLSLEFDPITALARASEMEISRANPWMEGSLVLDNIGKCATLLPEDNPLYHENHHEMQIRKVAADKHLGTMMRKSSLTEPSSTNKDSKKRQRVNIHPFEVIASQLDSGPHSLLFRLREERKYVKVVVRFVNMVRGTLTGILIAFDKHMNMILRDVEEVYSPRLLDEENNKSNLELELERRQRVNDSMECKLGDNKCIFDDGGQQNEPSHQPGWWNVRRRQMRQLLVRGDMVVSIYEACQEKRTVTKSIYRKRREVVGDAKTNDN